jgi:hypothetical protein
MTAMYECLIGQGCCCVEQCFECVQTQQQCAVQWFESFCPDTIAGSHVTEMGNDVTAAYLEMD